MTLKDLLSVLNDGTICVIWDDNTTPNEPPLYKGEVYKLRNEKHLLTGSVKSVMSAAPRRLDIFITL